jgi:hypothetical protein
MEPLSIAAGWTIKLAASVSRTSPLHSGACTDYKALWAQQIIFLSCLCCQKVGHAQR